MTAFRTHLCVLLAFGSLNVPVALGGDIIPAVPVVSLSVTAPKSTVLTGEQISLTSLARFADGSTKDVTADANVFYASTSSDNGAVSITSDGKVTGVRRGRIAVFVSYSQSGLYSASDVIMLQISLANDSDNDGMPDAWETAHGLNPQDGSDGALDPDGDGLSNLQEYQNGTDPHNPDTDGDGIPDGLEVAGGTNPLDAKSPTPAPAPPKLDQNCTAGILNHTVQIGADGTFALQDIPVDEGLYRVRAVCRTPDGKTIGGQSEFIMLTPATDLSVIRSLVLGTVDPIPVSVSITSPTSTFTASGQTSQLIVRALLPDGTTKVVTPRSLGTTYSTSNTAVATVGVDGLVTAVGRGMAIISARNEGAIVGITVQVNISNSAANDGIPDDWKRAYGFSPGDASVAGADPDRDGLTNFQEYQRGTNPNVADTDGDGLNDGDEVALGTNPLSSDSDGDGIPDGQEVQLGTNPLNRDTDGDGIADGLELRLGLNPLRPDAVTSVQGRVVNGAGAPVPAASITLFGLITGTADGTGAFSINSVPAALGNITASAVAVISGSVISGSSSAVAPVTGGSTNVGTIQLGASAGTVSGIVTDVRGQPMSAVQISVLAGNDQRDMVSDSAGRYAAANLVPGTVTVIARDPSTGLRGSASGLLGSNQGVTINVMLAPSGRISGTVLTRDGKTPVAAAATVTLSSGLSQTTDAFGRFQFDFVPLGAFAIDAYDANGNHGRSNGTITVTGQTTVSDIVFLGKATVSGVVKDGAGAAVPNASVNLSSQSIFGGSQTAVSDSTGAFSFPGVFVGPFSVSARATIQRLGGQTSGMIDTDGQTVAANITLAASGSISGTVFRSDGATKVGGAQVTLSPTGLQAAVDSNGVFRFDFLPLGTYSLNVTDTLTGDRGKASGTVAAQDQVATVNVSLNGQGQVTVTVKDGAGSLVPNANVTLTSQTSFGGTQTAATSSSGTAVFARILAGGFSVAAIDPVTQLGGSANSSVAVGGNVAVTVTLQSTGSVKGTVFQPNGTTPASNISVQVLGQVTRSLTVNADGTFRFDTIPTGTYTLRALDSLGNTRAQGSFAITVQGQVLTTNLTLVGIGRVSGLVTDPAGQPVSGVAVSVASSVSGFNQIPTAFTDVSGHYLATGVPVGSFSVSVNTISPGGQPESGAASGFVSGDGQTATANIALAVNVVPLPSGGGSGYASYDANNFTYNFGQNGALLDGTTGIFTGTSANHGAELLDLIASGNTLRFSGAASATSELGGRQLAIQQSGLAGLNVTRKLYTPANGYFTRYVELLNNAGSSPVTVKVRLTSNYSFISKVQGGFRYDREPRIVATSSGDTLLDVTNNATRDHWILIDDDEDLDPFLAGNLPNAAEVFDGAGAASPADTATYNIDFTNNFGQLVTEWQSITIPAGQTVGLLHFVAQETLRSAGLAAAGRLAQLPPEALAGLTAAELASIRNFSIPAGGVSTLTALPSLTGQITGKVLDTDGVTPLPSATVHFQSTQPLFRRTYTSSSDGNGNFVFTGAILAQGSSTPVPVADFVVDATLPQSGVQSGPVAGTFPSAQAPAVQNIRFSNSANISGTVRRFDNTVVSSGYVQAVGTDIVANITAFIGTDGSYRFIGLQPGSYVLSAVVSHPQGTALTATSSATVTAGQLRTLNLVIGATGTVAGAVTRAGGAAAVNIPVTISATGFQRQTSTDTAGKYTLLDIPIGSFSIATVDSSANTAASATVAVTANAQVITQNFTLSSGGTVTGIVTNAAAQPLQGTQVTLVANNGTFNTTTDAAGRYTFNQISPGNLALNFVNTAANLRGRTTGSLSLSGQTVTINFTLIAAGTVSGIVYRSDGTTPAPGLSVQLYQTYYYGYYAPQQTTVTDGQGRYLFDLVPIESFTLIASDSVTGDRGLVNNQVNTNGESRTVNVILNGVGRVIVTVKSASGVPVSNSRVTVTSSTQFGGSQVLQTLSDGTATFANVLAGGFTAVAADSASGLGGSISGTVAANATANVIVQLQPSGSILGKLFAPDGTTPVTGARVRVYTSGYDMSMTTSSDGSYRFDAVPLGTYTLDGYDNTSVLRARKAAVALAVNGDSAVQNLTLNGQGQVSGHVLNPSHAGAANLPITLQSGSTFGGTFNTVTDAQGAYSFNNVPAGSLSVTARDTVNMLLGQTLGQIAGDGQTLTLDIQLASNQVTLPVNLYDGNDFLSDIQTNGSQSSGSFLDFYGNGSALRGAMLLDIVQGGTATRFNGATFGTADLNGRQITVNQVGVASLNVTRRIYTPIDGYFSRYIETLANPGASPVTVDLKVTSGLFGYYVCSNSAVIATSTGGSSLNVSNASNPDRWVVVDDTTNLDPFVSTNHAAIAFTFDGPGGVARIGDAVYSGACSGSLTYTWKNVTVPAGGTVSFMHFDSQQATRGAASASAQRLVQLPPEALAGLTGVDAATIQNFVLPAGLMSSLSPLPALTGSVSGKVLETSGGAAVPSAPVKFQSSNPIFARTFSTTSDAQGNFSFVGSIGANGTSKPVPIDAFTLMATHPGTNSASTPASGNFGAGSATATQNLIFSNLGSISGIVRRASGAVVTSGTISLVPAAGSFSIAADGSYSVVGLTSNTYSVLASIPNPQGTSLTGSTTVTVVAGQNRAADIVLQATGTVTGIVTNSSGSPMAGVTVRLNNGGTFTESAVTGSDGSYTLSNAAIGSVTITATDPNTGLVTSAAATVIRDQTSTVNLMLQATGTIQLTVKYAGGSPVAGASVYSLTWGGQATGVTYRGGTSSAGLLTLTFVPVGAFTLRVYNPNNNFIDTLSGTVTNGQTSSVTLNLTGSGVISGKVTFANGSPAANSQVQIFSPTSLFNTRSVSTDSNGNYSASQIPVGTALTVRASNPSNTTYYRQITTSMLASDGQTLTVNVQLPAFATLSVTALKADSTPYPAVNVYLTTSFSGQTFAGTTDSAGKLIISNVPEGNVTLLAQTSSGTLVGSSAVTVSATDQGNTIAITITAPFTGTVKGTVYAGDGVTPLVTNYVYFYDNATGSYVTSSETDNLGRYQIDNVVAGGAGFLIRAYYYVSGLGDYVSGSNTGTFSGNAQTVTVDVTVPVSVVSGVVYRSDGTTRVPSPSVTAFQSGSATAAVADATGGFVVFGLVAGDFLITAQSDGLTGAASGNLPTSTSVAMINVNLQSSGTVTGKVTTSAGAAVIGATVAVRSSAANLDLTGTTDSTGTYSFPNVASGNISVQARDANSGLRGSGTGVLATNSSVTIDVALPATGSITGTVFMNGGVTPIPNPLVTISNSANNGVLGSFSKTVQGDAAGKYSASGIPAGNVSVMGTGQSGGVFGSATGILAAGGTSTIDVTLGLGFMFSGGNTFNLDGADGFRYDISSTGSVFRGGKADGSVTGAYNTEHLFYSGSYGYWTAQTVGTIAQSGREIDLGPGNLGVFSITRKIYSPPGGKFIRYLDFVTNNGSSVTSGMFYSLGTAGSNGAIRILTSPSTTSNQYAVVDQGGSVCCAVGFVMQGVSYQNPVTYTYFNNSVSTLQYGWSVKIDPGQTVAFLHYGIQRDGSGSAGVTTQAQSLVSLSDSDALTGISSAEKAMIVNFDVH